jgi:hypothetical protein
MGVPTSDVGYSSATNGRGDHEVHKGHVVALEKKIITKQLLITVTNAIVILIFNYLGGLGMTVGCLNM